MSSTSIGTIALIVGCGIVGPLLAGATKNLAPVVVGEVIAGVILGVSGTGTIDPTEPTLALLSDIGFATLMFAVGMNVPLHDKRLRGALGSGLRAAVAAAVLAVPAGLVAAAIAGGGHAATYAVIVASSSAAIALPIMEERGLGDGVLPLIAQITIADIAAVVAVPFALQPDRTGKVILGSVAVVAATLAFFALLRLLLGTNWYQALRDQSRDRGWALDLRVALAALLGLAFLAKETETSILIAGFGAGLVVGAVGGPNRLSVEVRGVAQGFLVPIFFVLLGARLDVDSLVSDPSNLGLAAALVVLNVAVHSGAALIGRQPLSTGLVASAQMGVPAAVVSLGLADGIINPGQGAAIIAAGMISLGLCSFGAYRLSSVVKPPAPAPAGTTS